MNYDDIRNLLNTRLRNVTGLPQLQTENLRITLEKNPWARSTLLTSEPTALTVGQNGTNEHQGLFQVDLFYAANGGTEVANEMASLVQAAFPRGTILSDGTTSVHVRMVWQDTSYTMPGDAWYCVPVKVRWTAYRASA